MNCPELVSLFNPLPLARIPLTKLCERPCLRRRVKQNWEGVSRLFL